MARSSITFRGSDSDTAQKALVFFRPPDRWIELSDDPFPSLRTMCMRCHSRVAGNRSEG